MAHTIWHTCTYDRIINFHTLRATSLQTIPDYRGGITNRRPKKATVLAETPHTNLYTYVYIVVWQNTAKCFFPVLLLKIETHFYCFLVVEGEEQFKIPKVDIFHYRKRILRTVFLLRHERFFCVKYFMPFLKVFFWRHVKKYVIGWGFYGETSVLAHSSLERSERSEYLNGLA